MSARRASRCAAPAWCAGCANTRPRPSWRSIPRVPIRSDPCALPPTRKNTGGRARRSAEAFVRRRLKPPGRRMTVFRIALVGAGEIGAGAHLPAILESDQLELAAIVDPVTPRAQALARE